MKVRWTNESLRLRITPTELACLQRNDAIEATLSFPTGPAASSRLLWRIVLRADAETTKTHILSTPSGAAQLSLSVADLDLLSEGEREGVYFPSGQTGQSINFYVEKDFPCIHPRPGDASEAPTEAFSPPPDFAARKT